MRSRVFAFWLMLLPFVLSSCTGKIAATVENLAGIKTPLVAEKTILVLAVDSLLQIPVKGGTGKVSYEILSGDGTISETGQFNASSFPSTGVINVVDEEGQAVQLSFETIAKPNFVKPAISLSSNSILPLGVVGGRGPYFFKLVEGGGLVTDNGVYYANGYVGAVKIQVQDSIASQGQLELTVGSALSLASPSESLSPSTTVTLTPLNAVSPVRYEVISGGGSVDQNGSFTSPIYNGTTVVKITDGLGDVVYKEIKVENGVSVPLRFEPTNIQLGEKQVAKLSLSGGSGAATVTSSASVGAFTKAGNTITYTAPANLTSSTSLTLTADDGATQVASTITVYPAPKVDIVSGELIANSQQTFAISGGLAPYSVAVDRGTASVSGANVTFVAPGSEGLTTMRIKDSLAQETYLTFRIKLGLGLVPAQVSVAKNSEMQFFALGGVAPYEYRLLQADQTTALSAEMASISEDGILKLEEANGEFYVEVKDGSGAKGYSRVNVYGELTVNPFYKVVSVNQEQEFTVSGGVEPITATLGATAPGGSIEKLSARVFKYQAPATTANSNLANILFKDASNIEVSANVKVNEVLSLDTTDLVNFKITTGKIGNIVAKGGVPPYRFSNSNLSAASLLQVAGDTVSISANSAGTTQVTVLDAVNNNVAVTVSILSPVKLTPIFVESGVGEVQTFTASEGLAPYTYSVMSGGGTIDSASGVFTAGNSEGSVVVKVIDALNNSATANIVVRGLVQITPSSKALTVNEGFTFSATKGLPPYIFSKVSGGGEINSTTGQFTSPSATGTTILRVTDAIGHTADATVTVSPGVSLSPSTITLAVNNTYQFTASGGTAPYTYALQSGGGSIDAAGLYTAPAAAGSAIVKVTDSVGLIATSNITINAALAISPSSKILSFGVSQSFTATGGVAPYSYTVVVSGAGSIGVTTGNYVAPNFATSEAVRVTDSLGNTSDASITVVAPVAISPNSKTLAVNNSANFSATGGVAPYTYSKTAGTGSIDSLTGVFTAPAAAGSATIRVADSLGNTSDATITINSALDLTPASSTIAVNQTKVLSVAGGVGPFSYSVISGTGSFNSGTMTYTATASATSAQVQVTDSLNNTDIAEITVVSAVSISPATPTVIVNETVALSGSGGSTPYSYAVTSGGGSVNASTGVYTAPAAAGSATVRVTDAIGQTANSTITINPGLSLSPTSASISVNNTQQFTASGGTSPYTYSIQSGGGSINASGLYTAPGAAGSAIVKVTDNAGRTATTSVTINDVPFAISPAVVSLELSGTATFTGSGGTPPYTYSVVSGGGSINSSTGVYTAPSSPASVVVRVTDALSATANANVSVYKNVYTFTGTTQTFVVPEGWSAIDIKAWGAGGGGGGTQFGTSGVGGGGGYVAGRLLVTPGETLTFIVGGGGNAGAGVSNGAGGFGGGGNSLSDYPGGGGGGRTAIRRGTTEILTAGGGGGAGLSENSAATEAGGAGGGSTGATGSGGNSIGGLGGSQVAGGAGGGNGAAGVAFQGGDGGYTFNSGSGGGGGGGYFGGGGGTAAGGPDGGGGGGSNYIGSLISAINSQGIGKDPANLSDVQRNGAGAGGLAGQMGAHGLLIISPPAFYIPSSIKVYVGATYTFSPVGGTQPISYALISGVGSINATTGVYTAPGAPGIATVRATNSDGATSDSAIVVHDVAINPASVILSSNGTQTFSVSGGSGPYTFSIVEGAGTINSSTGFYSAATTGSAVVRVTDSAGNYSEAVASVFQTEFTHTGAEQSFLVPQGWNSILVKAWGAGGGGGGSSYGTSGIGGGGAYAYGRIPVTPGEVITIIVGGGGKAGTGIDTGTGGFGGGGHSVASWFPGGGGGGRSAIRRGSVELLTAGGGGGSGISENNAAGEKGGAGGGTSGVAGSAGAAQGGLGGTQSAGGAGGTLGFGGTPGSAFQGGAGGDGGSSGSGGGGGGGYFGGGGGSGQGGPDGGGGGGSSYTGGVLDGVKTAGTNNTPGNSSDPVRAGAGVGGLYNENGTHGFVQIQQGP